MSEVNICQPFCRCCGDYHFVRNSQGQIVPCPRCSCPVCERLVDVHPDLGGCICFQDPIITYRQSDRLIVGRSPVVALPVPRDQQE